MAGNFPAHDGPGSCDQPNQPKLIYIIIIGIFDIPFVSIHSTDHNAPPSPQVFYTQDSSYGKSAIQYANFYSYDNMRHI